MPARAVLVHLPWHLRPKPSVRQLASAAYWQLEWPGGVVAQQQGLLQMVPGMAECRREVPHQLAPSLAHHSWQSCTQQCRCGTDAVGGGVSWGLWHQASTALVWGA